ncbi:hypothetical protein BT96DRAFT_938043 [Gymnopus androsaceus JB14]|uniref:CxC1-like cysteine cluster associated with KDZ transposases domain-containing protein n=1 Tax=Gymnopus androsaceus JB14 TaxID=1447944 RepID=A0A6A4HTB3_9AGAR|nr:hypothetical protein BT96DRAFT_938043 [Gymnopus androsaceus JB14]
MRDKGCAAEVWVLAYSLLEVTAQQEYGSPPDEPMSYEPYDDFCGSGDNAWVNQGSDVEDEIEVDETEVEKAARKVRVEYQDFWTKRDRTDTTNKYWSEQTEGMVDAYMDWCLREAAGEPLPECNKPSLWIDVVDIFRTQYREVPWTDDKFDSASLIQSGILPTSPLKHSTGFTIRSISLYHKLFVHCPRLGIQPFAKAICDLEGVAFRPYLSSQIYAALDVYYRLHEDDELDVHMIAQMDGNDSLKRVERKEDCLVDKEEAGLELPQASRERIDRRIAGEDYFASLEETKVWDESNWDSIEETSAGADAPLLQHVWAEGRCKEQWHNMKETNTVKSAAKFRENGWARYPLALVHLLMAAEKEERERTEEGRPKGSLAITYDIACKFSKTLSQSPLKTLAQWSGYLPVVGTMHGYSHERLCQLLFLMLYVVGCGLEDGEGDERFFNAISEFLYYKDVKTYSNLSRFLHGNYKQALGIISTRDALSASMKSAVCVAHRPRRPLGWNTTEVEHVTELPGTSGSGNIYERKHWNEEENEQKLIADVHALETCLSIEVRLECLLVARMFEMARLNVSGTASLGYKMRKHIAQSLKSCSKSIQNAITSYNEAAAALSPPRRKITWDEIVDFSYLSEFNILRDTAEDVRERKWATPQNRLLMTRFFKFIQAEEELAWVHVEVKRLLTYMVDEEERVCGKAKEVEAEDPALACSFVSTGRNGLIQLLAQIPAVCHYQAEGV